MKKDATHELRDGGVGELLVQLFVLDRSKKYSISKQKNGIRYIADKNFLLM